MTSEQEASHEALPDDADPMANWVLLTQRFTGAKNYVAVMDWIERNAVGADADTRALFVAALHESAYQDETGQEVLLQPRRLADLLANCRREVAGDARADGNDWCELDKRRKAQELARQALVDYIRTQCRFYVGEAGGAYMPEAGLGRKYIARLQELERAANLRPGDEHGHAGPVFCGLDNHGRAIHPGLLRDCWDLLPVTYHRRAMRAQNLPLDYVPWVMEHVTGAGLFGA